MSVTERFLGGVERVGNIFWLIAHRVPPQLCARVIGQAPAQAVPAASGTFPASPHRPNEGNTR